MLKELNIKNLAIIDQLSIEFGPGLNILTGETGAGKSIIIDALNLALGERASADLIRTGCDEATVEAAFQLNRDDSAEILSQLSAQGITLDPGDDLIIRRALSTSGKNKVYVNGSLANLSTLSALGASLADIHGQHEHQSLLSLDRQRDMLDSYGGLTGLRESVSEDHRLLQKLRKALAGLETGERERAQREDMLRFQKQEIEASRLVPGEDALLAEELKLLSNAERLSGLSRSADEELYTSDAAVLSGLKRAIAKIREIVEIDKRLSATLELCEAGRVQIEEAAREVSAYADRVEFDPGRLEEIGDRLDLIQRLKKKYGGSIEEVLACAQNAATELERIGKSGDEMENIKREIADVRIRLTANAQALTAKRKAAAQSLEKKVESELGHLGMKKTTFSVMISQEPGDDTTTGVRVGPHGADRIEFLISPNPGEEPKPLAKIASGGELSRIMLALKVILIESDLIPTLVFDEVDAGIGGAVAEEVGKKLKRIAQKRQVFCITHLPQIASMATNHYGVSKSVKKERTSAAVSLLSPNERVDEIARMLGGKTITGTAVQHAQEMIERSV